MRLNITDAAEMAGVSRGTIYNHIRNGKLSASIGEDGHKYVDVSELERAYGTLNTVDVQSDVQPDTIERVSDVELEVLRKENELLRKQLEQTEEREQDARHQVERLLGVLESQTRLLQGTKEKEEDAGENVETSQTKKRKWWPF